MLCVIFVPRKFKRTKEVKPLILTEMNIYTMIFALPQDKEDFILCMKRSRFVKVVLDVDRRSINVRFRKGTKAQRIFDLCDLWNADIWGLTC